MTALDPTSARAAALERLNRIAHRLGARIVTDDDWSQMVQMARQNLHPAHRDEMLATATAEANRMRELVLDLCDVAGGLSDNRPPIVRLSAIIGMAAKEALNPDTLR